MEKNSNKISYHNDMELLISKLEEFREEYEKFSKKVSPKHWRITGTHFSNLEKMKEDIINFTEISDEEKEIPWIKNQL